MDMTPEDLVTFKTSAELKDNKSHSILPGHEQNDMFTLSAMTKNL